MQKPIIDLLEANKLVGESMMHVETSAGVEALDPQQRAAVYARNDRGTARSSPWVP
jgi:hypothetical protein